jgi:hypothetical protein
MIPDHVEKIALVTFQFSTTSNDSAKNQVETLLFLIVVINNALHHS